MELWTPLELSTSDVRLEGSAMEDSALEDLALEDSASASVELFSIGSGTSLNSLTIFSSALITVEDTSA